jgi:hypothetical protein
MINTIIPPTAAAKTVSQNGNPFIWLSVSRILSLWMSPDGRPFKYISAHAVFHASSETTGMKRMLFKGFPMSGNLQIESLKVNVLENIKTHTGES